MVETTKIMQAVFDKALFALRKQNKRSISHAACRYRDGQGNACAIGHQFPDEDYLPEFDERPFDAKDRGTSVGSLMVYCERFRLVMEKHGLDTLPRAFLNQLQSAHDAAGDDHDEGSNDQTFQLTFNASMLSIATHWKLNYTEPTV
jgi:hypothetical protein